MSIEHTTRSITENKFMMQLFADKQSLQADIKSLHALKASNPTDPRASDYAIKQKEYELSQIENRTKGKDYSSVKNQCEKYFTDNTSLFDKNQIITETRSMLAKGQIVNEWPHLAAVFLLDHAVVTDAAKAGLVAVTKPIAVHPIGSSLLTPALIQVPQLTTTDRVGSEETIVTPTRPTAVTPQKLPAALKNKDKIGKSTVDEKTETSSNILKQLTNAYTDFKKYATKIDKWGGTFRDSKADIEIQHAELNNKIKTLTQLLDTYASHIDGTIRDTVANYRLNISYYLVDDFRGIQNNLYKNLGLSQNLAISVLNRDKKRLDPLPEGDDAMRKTLDSLTNTPLGNNIAEAMKQNPNKSFFEIISNPSIKGGWETAYSKIFEKSLSALDISIDTLTRDNSLDERQKKALYHLKTIRGKDGWLNFKTENVTAMWQGLKVGGAVVAGATATYFSAGGLAPWAAASIGAIVATGGTTVARGYWDGKETLIDGGINILSFGGGALVVQLGQAVRATKVVSNTGKIGVIGTGIGIDGAGNIGIGVIGDNIRAHLHGEDLNNWDSFKMNAIPWAIFAIAMNARGIKVPSIVVSDAQSVENSVIRIGILSRLGGSIKDELANIASKTPGLKKWGQANTVKNIPVTISNDLNRFKNLHLTGDSLYEKVIKLGGTKKIDIEGLPGYKIGMTEGKAKIEILKPDGKTIQFYQKNLGANLGAFYKKEHPVVVLTAHPTNTVGESIATPKTENKIEPVQSKENPAGKAKEQHATVSSENLTKQAHNPQAAHTAIESVSHSSKKVGETFSSEWIGIIANKFGKSVSWVADQSVGPLFRMVTGNNPSALLSLANPMGGWKGKAATYGNNLMEHWKSPVRNSINLLVTGERKDGQGAIYSIAKNVVFAGGITALDYFAVPNDQANTPANMAQNYYEMILLGWLGVVLMERGPIMEGAKDAKDWISDRIQAKPF